MLTQEKVPGTGRFFKWPVTGKFELKAFQGGNLQTRKAGFVCSKRSLETVGAGFGLQLQHYSLAFCSLKFTTRRGTWK